MVRLLAEGAYRSGTLQLVRQLSHHLETYRAPNGRKWLRRPRGPKLAILCYHRVGTGGVPYYSELHPRVFEAQIAFLRRAYRIVTLDQLCREKDEADGSAANSRQAVAITFDDGYRDLYTHAFPILRKYGLPATVYLTASAIETGEVSWYDRIFALAMLSRSETLDLEGAVPCRFLLSSRASRLHAAGEIIRAMRRGYTNQRRMEACAELERKSEWSKKTLQDRMLCWDQIREMQNAGICFGSHTMNHPALGRLSVSECRDELLLSKRLLEDRLQRPVEHFAFPFGLPSDLSPETCALVPACGYRSGVTTVWGLNTPRTNSYLLRRIGCEDLSVSMLAFRLRALFLNEPPVSNDMQALELALEMHHGSAPISSSGGYLAPLMPTSVLDGVSTKASQRSGR